MSTGHNLGISRWMACEIIPDGWSLSTHTRTHARTHTPCMHITTTVVSSRLGCPLPRKWKYWWTACLRTTTTHDGVACGYKLIHEGGTLTTNSPTFMLGGPSWYPCVGVPLRHMSTPSQLCILYSCVYTLKGYQCGRRELEHSMGDWTGWLGNLHWKECYHALGFTRLHVCYLVGIFRWYLLTEINLISLDRYTSVKCIPQKYPVAVCLNEKGYLWHVLLHACMHAYFLC